MLEVFYIYMPSTVRYEKVSPGLKKWISEETYREIVVYKNERVKLFRSAGEALVRYVLKTYWHIAPFSYRILRQKKGKPYLEGVPNLFFNISHSGDYLVCAFSDQAVGIDIEKRQKARMEVASRFFHSLEVERLKSVWAEKKDRLFYDFWSVKESFLKYTGAGLTRPMSSFLVAFEEDGIFLHEENRKLPLEVSECPIDHRYSCFVCSEQNVLPRVRECSISIFQL